MAIQGFTGPYRFLSNFWPSPWVTLDGMAYPTVEHAYQAAKTINAEERFVVQQASTPGKAKAAGRRVRVRGDWDRIKRTVMFGLLEQKFAEKNLRAKLAATGTEEIVEANTWGDTFWGVCGGIGANELGRMLMTIRARKL